MYSFGDKLKECRKAKNLTLEELAYKYNRRFANTGLDIFSEIQKWNNSQDDF